MEARRTKASEAEALGVDTKGDAPWVLCTGEWVEEADIEAPLVTDTEGKATLTLGEIWSVTSADYGAGLGL
ncbi:unnamed protein product [Ilex paraguariensis]|uniref:Uncharacterized protein n=1 Tax=Ilex paraguariensis TaxID=185542 RepID=A0ABC8TMB0_9AQUA